MGSENKTLEWKAQIAIEILTQRSQKHKFKFKAVN